MDSRHPDMTRQEKLTKILTFVAGSIAISVLTGWVLRIPVLMSLSPHFASMKVNTALAILALSAGIALASSISRLAVILRKLLAGTTALMAIAMPGSMAPVTVLCLLLLSLGVAAVKSKREGISQGGQILALSSLLITLQTLVIYLFRSPSVGIVSPYTHMPEHTAVAFTLLSLALLNVTRKDALIHVLSQPNLAGRGARRLVLAVITIPPIVISLQLRAESAGILDSEIGGLIRLIVEIGLFVTLVGQSASRLYALDKERMEKAEDFKLLTEAIPQLVWTADPLGKINLVTRRWSEFVGKTVSPETNMLELMHPDDIVNGSETWKRAVEKGEPFGMEYRLRHRDGEFRWQLTRALPLKDEAGKILRWFGSCTDIHDQKMEQAAHAELTIRESAASESSRLKSEFLAAMSHEVRTPVSGVIGMTALLMETPLDAQQKSYAEAIRTSGQALLAVMNDILDLSKIEAGKLDFEEADFLLAQTVEEAWLTVKHVAHQKNLTYSFEVDDRLPAMVRGDAGRLRQVLMNLLANAVKFTLEGTVAVKLTLISAVDGVIRIRADIRDTGIGVSQEAQARLFQPFSQGDGSMARRFGGTGLGLSISRRLVQHMGGDIGVESEVGKGANFWFTVALKTAGEGSRSLARPFSQDGAPGRILIADDMQINQIIARRMVEKLGHTARIVESGAQVLDALRQEAFDLVLLDCQMPGMDGYEVATLIRASQEIANPQIPIIATTANVMRGEKEKCLAAGMNDYVSKPLSETVLAEAIERWLSHGRRAPNVA